MHRDLVAPRLTATGAQTGPFQGIPPAGGRVRYSGIDIDRIADAKIVEARVSYDALGLPELLGEPQPHACRPVEARDYAGLMFWLTRKRLPGSYFALICASRS